MDLEQKIVPPVYIRRLAEMLLDWGVYSEALHAVQLTSMSTPAVYGYADSESMPKPIVSNENATDKYCKL